MQFEFHHLFTSQAFCLGDIVGISPKGKKKKSLKIYFYADFASLLSHYP